MRIHALLLSLALLPIKVLGHDIPIEKQFVLNKQCDLYTISEANKNTPKSTLKTPNPSATDYKNPEYIFKNNVKIHSKEYVTISGSFTENGTTKQTDYLLLKECGKLIDKPTLNLDAISTVTVTTTPMSPAAQINPSAISTIFDTTEYSKLDTVNFKNSLDGAILGFCGNLNNTIKKEDLRSILMDKKFEKDLNTIHENIRNKPLERSDANKISFVNSLVKIFFEQGGMRQTVCGLIDETTLKGTPYYYRLIQLEKNNNITKGSKSYSETNGIHSISAKFKTTKNVQIEKPLITFVKTHTITDIFSIAGMITRTSRNTDTISCLYNYKNIPFQLTYRNEGLVNLYPMSVIKEEFKNNQKVCQFADISPSTQN